MDEEKNETMENEDVESETVENDNREEETSDEIRDEVYSNDDEIEMLRSIEKRFNVLEEKIDNMISMYVDSGAIVQDSVEDDISEQERDNYDDDFINIDDMDLSL